MKMKLGNLFMLVGIAFLALGTFAPGLATIIYNPPDAITYVLPYGTAASPASLAVGTLVHLQCDVATGNSPTDLEVSAHVPLNYGMTGNDIALTYNGIKDPYGGYEFTGTWTIPSSYSGSSVIGFKSVDSANGQTATYDSAIVVVGATPAGYFMINGQQVTSSSKVGVSSPNIQFDGYITGGQAAVTNMRVVIEDSNGLLIASLTLPLASGNHYGPVNYTLPGYGTYTVTGYIIGNGLNVPVMSIFATWGTGTFGLDTRGWLWLIGAAFVVVGLLMNRKV